MDKLDLPVEGERTWFPKLVTALTSLDGRFTADNFSRDYVLTNGLSKPGSTGDFGYSRFKIGDMNIIFGWGELKFEAKAYQAGCIQLPYSDASYRCVLGSAFTWDGDLKFDSSEDGKIIITPKTDISGTWNFDIVMMWSSK